MAALEQHDFTYGIDGSKKIAYLATGPQSGPLIVFIHGWPAIAKVWKPQLECFASLGFRAVAPDMPGYGGSTVSKQTEDYSQKSINQGMLALLEHLGREQAVWIGHDWGCGSVWTFAACYPERCVGVAALTVPYRTIELGLEELVKYVNREIYPESEYPHGQWSYMNFYEEAFDKALSWMEADIASFVRLGYSKGNPATYGAPAYTAAVTQDGGWRGGTPAPDPSWKHIPIEMTVLDEETYAELVSALEKNGMRGPCSWYMNHERNRKYTLENAKNDGRLDVPSLFIGARFDGICATSLSRMCEPMRKYCTNLTECCLDAGHWVAEEKPIETNAVIARWLVEKCPAHWPGYWLNAFANV